MRGIQEGTPEWEAIKRALAVAVCPPLDPRTPMTMVPVREIQDLRDALDGLGIDWRKVKEARAMLLAKKSIRALSEP